MDNKQMPFGNPFWMAASLAPALAVTQSMMDAAMRIYWAGVPARMVMRSTPFAMMGWTLSQLTPQPDLVSPETSAAPGKRTEGATDAEIVTSPRPAPRMKLVVPEPVVEETAPEAPVAPAEEPAPDMVASERPTALAEAPEDGGDDLKLIKGVGVKLAAQLNELGYYRFSQIAAWGEAELAWVDSNLTGFTGRATRDDWIGQARELMADPASGAMH